MIVIKVLFVACLVSVSNAFVSLQSGISHKRAMTLKVGSEDVLTRISESREALQINLQKLFQEDSAGEQALVLLQGALIVLLGFGTIPLIGDLLNVVCGPGLILAGVGLLGTGALELGPKNLTPSLNPVEDNELKTNGAYALSRHPLYTGLLLSSTGLAVTTQSFQRVIIVLLLYLLLDYKATKEEEALVDLHPAYRAYQSTVPKLLPDPTKLFTTLDN
uniref:Protein-S-isoprenylcysteine O-methyltransferase n=1 Tax=Aureoumbra lagunensis TaxID=44058 RepID=A0A7S3K3G9_9STRA|mmetsp:Transcript_13857/g.20773  ORF Transcript_13857/g.20773 Transcript_13857/m.20773 type:complete len:219 (-) Transcript_13857:43-699(-)